MDMNISFLLKVIMILMGFFNYCHNNGTSRFCMNLIYLKIVLCIMYEIKFKEYEWENMCKSCKLRVFIYKTIKK